MIRLIFVALFVVLFLIIGIPVLGIEWLIGKVSKKTMDYSSLRLVQWAFNMIIKLAGIELTVIGEENISEGPVLYIGNHRSFFDIVITYARCKNLTGYIAKKEMLSIPLLRTWMKRLYCLFLDRENPKEGLKTILQAIDYVKHGISIFEGHFPFIKKTHVILEYGKPIYPKELDKDEKKRIGEYCSNIISETIHKNQALV